jgi:hypothetical protein|tara:strand:- start:392 stop:583 length:192 start_codon:yes stop_codon:yes gene_type:complete
MYTPCDKRRQMSSHDPESMPVEIMRKLMRSFLDKDNIEQFSAKSVRTKLEVCLPPQPPPQPPP